MYRINPEKEKKARALFLAGHSGLSVARIAGIDKNTAWALAKRMISEGIKLDRAIKSPNSGRTNYPSAEALKIQVFNGECACGCGMNTSVLKFDDPATGRKAGQHRRYVAGHYYRHMRALGFVTGKQADRAKRREIVRRDLVMTILDSEGKKSLQEIAQKVAPDFELEGCSRLVNSARKWGWIGGEILRCDIPRILVRPPKKIIPIYERPEIPNERETEIALLSFQRNFSSLDAPEFDDGNGHSYYSSNSPTPLEILMMKEEMESEEYWEREKRLEEWGRWNQRKQSVFKDLVPP